MIMGGCPYCDVTVTLSAPEKMPVWGHETCPSCGKTFWEYYSRITPLAMTEEGFAIDFVVDEATKTITARSHEA